MPVIEEKQLQEGDIDLLASDMKENLRLTSYCGKTKRAVTRHMHSPYTKREDRKGLAVARLPRRPSNVNKSISEDPYDMLQELLNKGCLIQEAVKRLQLGVPKCKKLYDSDDENTTPLAACQ